MKLNLENKAHLKITLLSEGIKIDPIFFSHFTDEYKSNLHMYSKDNKMNVNFPNYMLLSPDVACAINLDLDSEWTLSVNKGEFWIKNKKGWVQEVTFENKPMFYTKEFGSGVVGKELACMNAVGSLSFFINSTCYMFDKGLPCKYCGYKPTRGIVKNEYKLTPQLAAEVAQFSLKNEADVIKYIYFSAGTFEDFDYGFKTLFDFVSKMKQAIGNQRTIEIMNFPPNDLKLIKNLKDLGANSIDFCIELANKTLFQEYCPGKHKFYGYDRFIEAATEAAKHFKKRAFMSVVMGLDTEKDLIDFMWWLAEQGITISLNTFYPSPYSQLRNRKRPSKELIYNIIYQQQKIFKQYDLTPFVPCSYRHGFDYEAYKQML